MEKTLKKRLVGAVILFLVAVIFIPAILSESPKKQLIDSTDTLANLQVDTNPSITPITKDRQQESSLVNIQNDRIDTPETQMLQEPNEQDIHESQSMIKTPETQMLQEPNEQDIHESQSMIKTPENQGLESKISSKDKQSTQDTSNLPAWFVQLGSFTHEENARVLNGKLKEAGYLSFIESISGNGKMHYRVRIGPETKRSNAKVLLDKITQDFGGNGMLVK